MLNVKTTLPLLLVNLLAVTADTSVTVKKQIGFGKRVVASFNVDIPTTEDWIGIYRSDTNDNLSANPFEKEDPMFWAYTKSISGNARTTGTATFNGIDPSEEWDNQWPVNPGKYKVCLMRESDDDNGDESGELLADCVPLKINLARKKRNRAKNKAQVWAPKKEVKFDEPFQIKFNSKFKVPNSSIMIYFPKDAEDVFSQNEAMWVYTGCDNVQGDQVPDPNWEKSNDCRKKRKKGTVNFNATNTGRAKQDWPLPVGEYVVRLEYYNNLPQALYKQAKINLKVVA